MRLGKLNNAQLEDLVLSKFKSIRDESIKGPQVGDDCAVLDLGGELVVLSSDPITSAQKNLGRLSVHISCNDAAAAGAEPVGLLVTLLAPPYATPEQIEEIALELSEAAQDVGVDILGGHTEVTDSVNCFITSTTVIAKQKRENLLPGMREGDDIVLTKTAGLEGSLVIASDYKEALPMLSEEDFCELYSWTNKLSVVKEGLYAAAHGASAMHDVTEGGVYGAAWEMAYHAGIGITLDPKRIPVSRLTKLICDALGLDAMRLLSSGCMLIACQSGPEMVSGLNSLGIPSAVIGRAGGEGLSLTDGTTIAPPEADELYKL